MKAIVNPHYGTPDVLQLVEVEKPAPRDNQVLIKVHTAALNMADWHLLTADIFLVRLMMGLFKPKFNILGADVAGTVEAVGPNARQFRPGEAVFGDLAGDHFGGLAEYVCAREDLLARIPEGVAFETAAALPMAAVTALQSLRDHGQVRPGQQVLIHGASGGVGTYAVQIAKALGAEVTAVVSTPKIDLARSLGADHVIDYTREDFAGNGRRYDLIVGANGNRPVGDYLRALKPTGTLAVAGGSLGQYLQLMLLGRLMSRPGGKQAMLVSAQPKQADLAVVAEMLTAGKVKPVIDRCYPLEEAANALRYLGEGHARGKVMVRVAGGR